MYTLLTVALFSLAAAAPPALQPQARASKQILAPQQFVYLQGAQPQYTRGAFVVGTPQYQVSAVQPSHQLAAVQYSQPQQVAYYKAPEVHNRVFTSGAAAVPAAVHEPRPVYAILRSNLDNNFDGTFQYDFETENGITMAATGAVKQLDAEKQAQVIQGSYSFITPEGQVITTSYTADENGFVAHGDHLPVAPAEPELPPHIAKSLAYIRSLPPQPENQQ